MYVNLLSMSSGLFIGESGMRRRPGYEGRLLTTHSDVRTLLCGKVSLSRCSRLSCGMTYLSSFSVKKGNALARSYFTNNKKAPGYLYSMLPRSLHSHTYYVVASMPQDFSASNTGYSSFYAPEFNAVTMRLLALQESDDSEALDAYIGSRKEAVNGIMNVSNAYVL